MSVWREVGGLDEKGEGTKQHKLAVTKESWECEVHHGNILNNVVITMVQGGVLDYCGDHVLRYIKCPTAMLYT